MNVERVLKKFIMNNKKGANELKEAMTNPESIFGLCSALSNGEPQIRQIAAGFLKEKLSKRRCWLNVPLEKRVFIKAGLIETFVLEQEDSVKTAVGQVIRALLRLEFEENGWPELFAFLEKMTTSDDIRNVDIGFSALHILTGVSADMSDEEIDSCVIFGLNRERIEPFLNYTHSFAQLFTSTLQKLQDLSSGTALTTVLCMADFASSVEGDEFMVAEYRRALPLALEAVRASSRARPGRAAGALRLVDRLAVDAPSVAGAEARPIARACLELCSDPAVGDALRARALRSLGLLAEFQAKRVAEQDLHEPLAIAMFRLMCEGEESPLAAAAGHTLELLFRSADPDKLLAVLVDRCVALGSAHPEARVREAAFAALAVAAERRRPAGAPDLFSLALLGVRDPVPAVAGAALRAAARLRPDRASEVVPALLNHISVSSRTEPIRKIEKTIYALRTLCCKRDVVLAFLPSLMSCLLPLASPPHPVRLRKLAVCSVAEYGNIAKEAIMPYFFDITAALKPYLTEIPDADTRCLRVRSVNTLAVLARVVGEENFRPLASHTTELCVRIAADADDPDLLKAAYGLFVAAAAVLKADMGPHLGAVTEALVRSVRIDRAARAVGPDDGADSTAGPLDPLDDEDGEEESGDSMKNESRVLGAADAVLEVSSVEAAVDALLAIRELARHCDRAFFPYAEKCFEAVFRLACFDEDLRCLCFGTLSELCAGLHNVDASRGDRALDALVPMCAESVRSDFSFDAVSAGLACFRALLRQIGGPVLGAGRARRIVGCVEDVVDRRTGFQDPKRLFAADAKDNEQLVEAAEEIGFLIRKVMTPQEFHHHVTL